MSDVFSIFMPGHAHWDEVKRAEKMLLVDAKQGGSGPDPLDLDEGYMVLSAADDISAMPPAAYSND